MYFHELLCGCACFLLSARLENLTLPSAVNIKPQKGLLNMRAPFPEHASGFLKTYSTLIWTTNLLTVKFSEPVKWTKRCHWMQQSQSRKQFAGSSGFTNVIGAINYTHVVRRWKRLNSLSSTQVTLVSSVQNKPVISKWLWPAFLHFIQ